MLIGGAVFPLPGAVTYWFPNSLSWRFVWLAWLPIYALLYWVPRWG